MRWQSLTLKKGYIMSQYSFSQVPRAEVRRSKFDRSHGYKTAFDSGYLIPFYVDDVLPGDTFNLTTSMIARLTTPIVPVMDNVHLDTFFFFVPSRLVWDNFQRFFGEQDNPGDSIDFTEPQIDLSDGAAVQSIFDYLGVPPNVKLSQPDWPSALPFRAINLIWNEWFRDQNLQDSVPVNKGDGPDPVSDYSLLKRCKRHDYFTSSLPWPQKSPGGGVQLSLGQTAPVVGTGLGLGMTDGTHHGSLYFHENYSSTGSDGTIAYPAGVDYGEPANIGETATNGRRTPLHDYKVVGVSTDPEWSGLEADLSSATAITINSLREAFAMQSLLEALARSGSRYTELLRGVFNVISPDARLQRPEFLGGSRDFIAMQQVPQTSATDASTPQGHLAAFGYLSSVKHGFQKSFVEHGYVIGFVNVWCDLSYQQGLPRYLSRRTRWDYYWPQLANIGEQPILNKEIYLSSDTEQNNAVFGYQERNAEYRYHPSMITGQMRSQTATPLDQWHLAQKFETLPTLSSAFIEENPPLDRVLAVQNEPEIFLDAWFDLKCVRPMPLFSIPGLGNRM